MKSLYFVTGANHTHGSSLPQLLGTLRLWERWTRVVVYDLGLSSRQRKALLDCDFNGSVETFPFEEYPAFFDINVNAGQYAWKPALVQRELNKSNAPLCWMDAGNYVRRPLWGIRRTLRRAGFYCPSSSHTVSRWTHPLMIENLGLPPDFCADKQNLNTACVAFDPLNAKARHLADEWARCAMDENIIGPPGSSRANHRQDQALLTVLAYRDGMVHEPIERRRGYSLHRDVPEAGE